MIPAPTGRVSNGRAPAAARGGAVSADVDMHVCGMCMTDRGEYTMSDHPRCTHFYCPGCIHIHLREALATGAAPVVCPGCADDGLAGPARPPPATVGLVTGRALTLLHRQGVIDLKLQFRIMRLQGELQTRFFECPREGCDRLLVDSDVNVVHRSGPGGVAVHQVHVGRCECGARVCVGCHAVVPPARAARHVCRQAEASVAKAKASYQLLEATMQAGLGKRCPKCHMYVRGA